ncbi:MAG: helix-turn-helix domain-containing protein [Gemmatimonadales bacterium]
MQSTHTPAYRAFLVRLIQARRATGLRQVDVARQLGFPQSRLSRIECGERRIDVVELAELARLYRRSLRYFLPQSKGRP